MKKYMIILTAVCCLIALILIFYFHSDVYYSKKLVNAIRKQDINEVKWIIDRHPNCINAYPSITPTWWHSAMDFRVMYPLTEACYIGNQELIKLLVEKGADVNCNDGLTPLSVTYARKNEGWYGTSQYLIDQGALLNYKTRMSGNNSAVLRDIVQQRPGMHDSTPNDDEEVLLAFVYAIERLDSNTFNWNWVLSQSITNDRIPVVRFIFEQGYCVANDSYNGMTPLMFAARDSTTEMIQLLLDYGADKSIKSHDEKTAYDYAVEYGRIENADLLK